MMTWNYRVVRKVRDLSGFASETFTFHEVYYDDDGKASSCTEDPVEPIGDSIEDLARELQLFIGALNKPVLNYTDFEKTEDEMVAETCAALDYEDNENEPQEF